MLRRGTDLDDLYRRYDDAVERTAAASGRVLLFTSIGRIAGGSGRVAQALADRFAAFNRNVRGREWYGADVVDLEQVEVLTDRRLWHTDRCTRRRSAWPRRCSRPGVGDPVVQVEALPAPPRPAAPTSPPTRSVREHLLPWKHDACAATSSGDGREPDRRVDTCASVCAVVVSTSRLRRPRNVSAAGSDSVTGARSGHGKPWRIVGSGVLLTCRLESL